jgi:hypothetical protein
VSVFTFPKPGERTNASTIPVAEHTLAALYALACVGRDHLTMSEDCYVIPQCQDAIRTVGEALSVEHYEAAEHAARDMEEALTTDYPF